MPRGIRRYFNVTRGSHSRRHGGGRHRGGRERRRLKRKREPPPTVVIPTVTPTVVSLGEPYKKKRRYSDPRYTTQSFPRWLQTFQTPLNQMAQYGADRIFGPSGPALPQPSEGSDPSQALVVGPHGLMQEPQGGSQVRTKRSFGKMPYRRRSYRKRRRPRRRRRGMKRRRYYRRRPRMSRMQRQMRAAMKKAGQVLHSYTASDQFNCEINKVVYYQLRGLFTYNQMDKFYNKWADEQKFQDDGLDTVSLRAASTDTNTNFVIGKGSKRDRVTNVTNVPCQLHVYYCYPRLDMNNEANDTPSAKLSTGASQLNTTMSTTGNTIASVVDDSYALTPYDYPEFTRSYKIYKVKKRVLMPGMTAQFKISSKRLWRYKPQDWVSENVIYKRRRTKFMFYRLEGLPTVGSVSTADGSAPVTVAISTVIRFRVAMMAAQREPFIYSENLEGFDMVTADNVTDVSVADVQMA